MNASFQSTTSTDWSSGNTKDEQTEKVSRIVTSKRVFGSALIAVALVEIVAWPCTLILASLIVPIVIYIPFQRLRIGTFAVVFAILVDILGRAHVAAIFGPLLALCFLLVFIMSLDAARMKERFLPKASGGSPRA